MNRLHFIADKKMLIRQVITSWLLLLIAVVLFTAIALILSVSISNPEMVIVWAFVAVLPFLLVVHIFLNLNNYYIKKSSKRSDVSLKPSEIILVNETRTNQNFNKQQIPKRRLPQFEQQPIPVSNISLSVSNELGGSVILKISDTALVLRSPTVTQILAKAATAVVVNTVGSVVKEIVINIGDTNNNIDYEMYKSRISLNASKLKIATDIIAQQINEAESNSSYPSALKEELKKRLYDLYYAEMKKIST